MDKFRDYISVILNGLHINEEKRMDLEDEIMDHLQLLKKEYMDQGLTEDQAEVKAMEEFGKTENINKKFKKVFSPFQMIKHNQIFKESLQWAVCIIITFIASMSINSFAFAGTQVKQCSMQNTLFEGQKLVEDKIVYQYSSPKRGDIVIINMGDKKDALDTLISNSKEFFKRIVTPKEEEGDHLVKRVIGLPGDKIDIKNGKVYINDKIYNESYTKGKTLPNDLTYPVTLKDHEYFVMGDNREVSLDSRIFGPVKMDRIEGKAVFRVWPLNKLDNLSQ